MVKQAESRGPYERFIIDDLVLENFSLDTVIM